MYSPLFPHLTMTLNRGTLTGSGSSCLVRWDAFTIPSEECLIDALYSQRQQTHEISLSVTAQEPSDWQSCWLNGGDGLSDRLRGA